MTTLSVGGIHPSGKAITGIGVNFELEGALRVSQELRALADLMGPKLRQRAIITLRRRIYTQARRDIQAEYNLSASRIAKDLRTSIVPAGVKVTGYFRGIGLRNFAARQTSRGVTYKVFRGGRRGTRQSAFFVGLFRGKGDNGNAHVAKRGSPKRRMSAGNYKGQLRAPLVTQYGPTVSQMLRKGRRPERLADFARGLLGAEVDRLVRSFAAKRSASG